jgi:hypothetical protein
MSVELFFVVPLAFERVDKPLVRILLLSSILRNGELANLDLVAVIISSLPKKSFQMDSVCTPVYMDITERHPRSGLYLALQYLGVLAPGTQLHRHLAEGPGPRGLFRLPQMFLVVPIRVTVQAFIATSFVQRPMKEFIVFRVICDVDRHGVSHYERLPHDLSNQIMKRLLPDVFEFGKLVALDIGGLGNLSLEFILGWNLIFVNMVKKPRHVLVLSCGQLP